MGNNPKPQPKDPRDEIEDAIITMKMTSKQFENASKRAQKEQKKEIDKAKAALKKNNEEGANIRLFLQIAANKFKESQNMLRMAHRMDAVSAQLRANITNSDLMGALKNVTPKLNMQTDMMDPEALAKNLGQYQKAMDELTVAGKIMDSAMNDNTYDEASDSGVENMLANLKQEIALEIGAGLQNDPTLVFNKIPDSTHSDVNVMGAKK